MVEVHVLLHCACFWRRTSTVASSTVSRHFGAETKICIIESVACMHGCLTTVESARPLSKNLVNLEYKHCLDIVELEPLCRCWSKYRCNTHTQLTRTITLCACVLRKRYRSTLREGWWRVTILMVPPGCIRYAWGSASYVYAMTLLFS